MEDTKKHYTSFKVLMFPWLAHGHISPFLELSKKLNQRNFKVYFCSTAINLTFIKKNFARDLSDHLIELVEFHLPELPQLPPQYHTTKNLPSHLTSTLMDAFQDAKPSFSKILNSLNPDLLIYDGFQTWAPKLAAMKSIPCVHFITSGAAALSVFYHQYRYGIDSDTFPSSAIFRTEYERKKIEAILEGNSEIEELVARCFELSSEFVLIKSSREVEEKYLDYLSFLCGKKTVTVGPLIQESSSHNENNDFGDVIKFLNKKVQPSVVFVSFGSEYFLSKKEREEIALGLELSDVNFIWAVRFPVGNGITSIEEALPEGFLERVKDRGMVVDGWAPQAKILEHSSIGGFVSHCGWNSTMESLYHGVPLIGMPIDFDQPTNARLIVEIGVGMEVMRDENGNFRRADIARVIKMVVLEKNGGEIRAKARELSKKLRLKIEEELDEALDELWNLCSKNKQQVIQRPS